MAGLGRCEGTAAHSELPPESVPCSLEAGEGPALPGLGRQEPLEKPAQAPGWGCPATRRLWGGSRAQPGPGMETTQSPAGSRGCPGVSEIPRKNDGFGSSAGRQGQSCCSGREIPLGSAHTQPGGASQPARCHPSSALGMPGVFPGIGQAAPSSHPDSQQESPGATRCPRRVLGSLAGLEEQPCRGRSRVQAGRSRGWDGGGRDGCQERRAPGTESSWSHPGCPTWP